ncbi:MAG: metallopeptidase TldD-related protein [Planctomycetota bacterium]|jgi:predicted Zn-dependent protease
MRERFYEIVADLTGRLRGREVLLANFSGEQSDFVRFNQSRVRQAGSVRQAYLKLELVDGNRHVAGSCTLMGRKEPDRRRGRDLLAELRLALADVPEDPFVLYAAEPQCTERVRPNRLPDGGQMADAALRAGAGLDMVGILAAGGIFAGFANSLGQRNWFETHSFHLDWCFYHAGDKAVKSSLAGFQWDQRALDEKVADARRQLDVLARPAKTIRPGKYRVYLASAALGEVMTMLSYGDFGLKAHRTKTSSLLKMIEAGLRLHPSVTLRENSADGIAPNFQSAGFLRPDSVTLVEGGRLSGALVCPRSAREYGADTNGADAAEAPVSLDMTVGDVPAREVAGRLDTGVYIDRLWYLNYSDRSACRMTGMTRFATFWVEDGQIVAPLDVMRFDETIYNMLGENLIGLTDKLQFLPSTSTYGARSTESMRLPGALVKDFVFTL